jgi:hypothetical protein
MTLNEKIEAMGPGRELRDLNLQAKVDLVQEAKADPRSLSECALNTLLTWVPLSPRELSVFTAETSARPRGLHRLACGCILRVWSPPHGKRAA